LRPTVDFSCMEALQNAAEHAHGATGVTITLTHDPHLRFEVSDDGSGFDPASSLPDDAGRSYASPATPFARM